MIRPYSTIEKIIYTVVSAIVVLYVAIRTHTVGLGNDEANTFFSFVHLNDFLPFISDYWSANNHYINTLFTWLSYRIFGVTEWALRLPNLLALPLFLFFTYKIGLRLKSTYLRWIFWILILSAHYLIEFFGYSRGYGLSMAFLMGAIHFLFQAVDKDKPMVSQLYLSLLLMSLALFSNLNLIISYLLWLALVQLPLLRPFNRRRWLLFNIPAIIPPALAVTISLILKSKEELYIGQHTLRKTIHTLMGRFADVHSETALNIFIGFLIILLILAVWQVIRKRNLEITPLVAFLILFGFNLLAVQLMYWWLDVLFPTERTAMHWYPLFAGLLVFTLDEFNGKFKKLLSILCLPIPVAVLIFGFTSINWRVSCDPVWAKEHIPDEFYFAVEDEQAPGEFPRSISASTSFYTFTWAFKNLKYGGRQDVCVDFKYWDPQYIADYLILDLKEYPDFTNVYDTLRYDSPTGMTLLKRKKFLQKKLLASKKRPQQEESTEVWTLLGEAPIPDSLHHEPVRIDYTLHLSSPIHPIPSLVTLEMRDSMQNTVFYSQFRVDHYKTDFSDNKAIYASLLQDSIPESATSMRTFYWNIKSNPFTLNSSRVDFYQLVEN